MGKILVTGANGFVGSALCRGLSRDGFSLRGAIRLREYAGLLPKEIEPIVTGGIEPRTEWAAALEGIEGIVHLAGFAHSYQNSKERYADEVSGAERLARQAAQHGVRRLVYLSTIKVNGEYSLRDKNGRIVSFNEEGRPDPQDNYALYKWKAEQALCRIQEESELKIIILRSPLIYGPQVKANFLSLIKLVDSRIPLPLAGIKNKRSLIYLGNLVDIICRCLTEPQAGGQVFLVSDGQDISTPELVSLIAEGLRRRPRLFPFPLGLMRSVGKIAGRLPEVERLTRSLVIDSQQINRLLNWKPPYTLRQGIQLTVDAYKARKSPDEALF